MRPKGSPSDLDALLEPLYGGLEDGDLAPFLEAVRRATDSEHATGFTVDAGPRGGALNTIVGLPAEQFAAVKQSYEANYAAANPMNEAAAHHMQSGRVLRVSDYASFDRLRRTEYYQGFLRPLEVDYTAGVVVDSNPACSTLMGLAKAAGDRDFSDREVELLQRLTPHLQRVSRLLGLMGEQRRDWSALEAAGVAAVQMDAEFAPRRVTTAMADLLQAGRLLQHRGGRVRGATATVDRLLFRIRAAALLGTGSGPRDFAPERAARDRDGRYWELTGLSVSRMNPLQIPYASFLLIAQPATDDSLAADSLRHRYGLTPAECDCALTLPSVESTAALARRLGVSTNTVRAHLRSIFAKTGVGRQAELVALLAREGLLPGQ